MTKNEVAGIMPHIDEVAASTPLDRRGWPQKPWDKGDWIILHECLSEAKRRMAERRTINISSGGEGVDPRSEGGEPSGGN